MIAGLEIHDLTLHEDNRGWFKENWAGQALVPRQQNVSYNARRGATRGMHAEPWDKWVSVATGLSLIHISEPTRREWLSRMPSSA